MTFVGSYSNGQRGVCNISKFRYRNDVRALTFVCARKNGAAYIKCERLSITAVGGNYAYTGGFKSTAASQSHLNVEPCSGLGGANNVVLR